jgi:hypothetical protein
MSSLVYSSEVWRNYNRPTTFSGSFLVLQENYQDLDGIVTAAKSEKGIQ